MQLIRVDPDAPDAARIEQAATLLRGGGIVAYPTDTLYGLAVDARLDGAVERLYDVKGRDASAAIPVIAGSIEQAGDVGVLTPTDMRLARAFWPGPLTLVLRARPGLSPRLLGQGSTIAVRGPAHPVARALAASLGHCVTATSANRSGSPPAAAASDVSAAFGSAIDAVIDGGPTVGGPPSTIIEVRSHDVRLVRSGAIAWERVLESLE
jgi:L-threonylcarbamoyladenylate synthase